MEVPPTPESKIPMGLLFNICVKIKKTAYQKEEQFFYIEVKELLYS